MLHNKEGLARGLSASIAMPLGESEKGRGEMVITLNTNALIQLRAARRKVESARYYALIRPQQSAAYLAEAEKLLAIVDDLLESNDQIARQSNKSSYSKGNIK